MKINEVGLRAIIEEELKAFKDRKNVANSKHPSDVVPIEDDNVGGILSDPFEHIPEDVPADVEKPQARVQDLTPIVKERRYSLRALLEQEQGVTAEDDLSGWAKLPKNAKIVQAWADVFKTAGTKKSSTDKQRHETHKILAAVMGHPKIGKDMDLTTVMLKIQQWYPKHRGEAEIGYDFDELIAGIQNAAAYAGYATGGGDPAAGEVDINEARFAGGLGFTNGSIAEAHCGCGAPDMSMSHVPSDHVVRGLEDIAKEAGEDRDLDHSDHEGSMARSQLRQAAKYSQKLGHMINESDNLPEWVEAKITKASDYLSSVYEYLDYELRGK